MIPWSGVLTFWSGVLLAWSGVLNSWRGVPIFWVSRFHGCGSVRFGTDCLEE